MKNGVKFSSCVRYAVLSVTLGLIGCHGQLKRQSTFKTPSSTRADLMPAISSEHAFQSVRAQGMSVHAAFHEPPTPSYPDRPLSDNLTTSLEVSDYVRALQVSGLFPKLQTQGPYTVFAIPNEPFERYARQFSPRLLMPSERAVLRRLLGYTIIRGYWDEAAIRRFMARKRVDRMGIKTLSGDVLTFFLQPQTRTLILMNGSGETNRIWLDGIKQSNGVLYFTQGLLAPHN